MYIKNRCEIHGNQDYCKLVTHKPCLLPGFKCQLCNNLLFAVYITLFNNEFFLKVFTRFDNKVLDMTSF